MATTLGGDQPRTSIARGLLRSGLLRRAFQAPHTSSVAWKWHGRHSRARGGGNQAGGWGNWHGRGAQPSGSAENLGRHALPALSGSLASHRRRLCRGGLIIRTAGMLRAGPRPPGMCLEALEGWTGASRLQAPSSRSSCGPLLGRQQGRQGGTAGTLGRQAGFQRRHPAPGDVKRCSGLEPAPAISSTPRAGRAAPTPTHQTVQAMRDRRARQA